MVAANWVGETDHAGLQAEVRQTPQLMLYSSSILYLACSGVPLEMTLEGIQLDVAALC